MYEISDEHEEGLFCMETVQVSLQKSVQHRSSHTQGPLALISLITKSLSCCYPQSNFQPQSFWGWEENQKGSCLSVILATLLSNNTLQRRTSRLSKNLFCLALQRTEWILIHVLFIYYFICPGMQSVPSFFGRWRIILIWDFQTARALNRKTLCLFACLLALL